MANNKEDDIKERLHDLSTRRKAFEEVVREFSEQLYWQIRRMVGSHDDANDILQPSEHVCKGMDQYRLF